MKAFLMLTVLLAASVFTGCSCANGYPHDTFIGASGWPASQVPIGNIVESRQP